MRETIGEMEAKKMWGVDRFQKNAPGPDFTCCLPDFCLMERNRASLLGLSIDNLDKFRS